MDSKLKWLCLNPLLPSTVGLRLQETPATKVFCEFSTVFLHPQPSQMEANNIPSFKKIKKNENRKVNEENADLFISTFLRMGREARRNAAPLPRQDGFPGGGNYLITTFSNRPVSLLIKVSLRLFGRLRMPCLQG